VSDELTPVQIMLDQWDENVEMFSDPGSMMADQNFRELIPHGYEAVTEIIRRMKLGQIYFNYFLLLQRICNFDPVPAQERGRVLAMGHRWIQWWENRHDLGWWDKLAEEEGIFPTEYGVTQGDVTPEQESS
jgi:hypothetical protein